MTDCAHPETEIRRRTQSNGVIAYWRQCLVCFQTVGTAMRHCDAPADAPSFDEAARNRYWQEQMAQRSRQFDDLQAARDRERDAWWERYEAYLESEEWARKRHLVLNRDHNRRQAHMDGCSMYATQVHHLSYKHVFNEPLFDLVAVCANCHETLHNDGVDA